MELAGGSGALYHQGAADTPAEAAGLAQGDVITRAVNGQEIAGMRGAEDAVQQGDSAESSNWPSTGAPAGSRWKLRYTERRAECLSMGTSGLGVSLLLFFRLVVCYDTYTAYAFSGKGVNYVM